MEYYILLTTRDRRRWFAAIIEMCWIVDKVLSLWRDDRRVSECVVCKNQDRRVCWGGGGRTEALHLSRQMGAQHMSPCHFLSHIQIDCPRVRNTHSLPLFILVLMKYNSEHQAPLSDRQTDRLFAVTCSRCPSTALF